MLEQPRRSGRKPGSRILAHIMGLFSPGSPNSPSRKRVLVINCYFDETRRPMSRSYKIPMPIGPPFLAGAFSRELCDVKIYNELYSGPLEDPALLAWPDMIVMTGLSTSLDRMRHITAYARTKNPRVIAVAGGHAVRSLPRYCRQFFDYCCLGDVEQLREVIAEAFGPQ